MAPAHYFAAADPTSHGASLPRPRVSADTPATAYNAAMNGSDQRYPAMAKDPQHVVIVMHGIARWAAARGRPPGAAWGRALCAVRGAVATAQKSGVPVLTLVLGEAVGSQQGRSTRVRDWLKRASAVPWVDLHLAECEKTWPASVLDILSACEGGAVSDPSLRLTVMPGCGGRSDIVATVRRLAEAVVAGRMRPTEITDAELAAGLSTAGLPEPDLILATGGRQRLDDILLWQSAYAELIFSERLWPDFPATDLENALRAYRARERRFGGVTRQRVARRFSL